MDRRCGAVRRSAAAVWVAAAVLTLVACSEQQSPTVDEPATEPTQAEEPDRLALPARPTLLVAPGADGEPEQRGTARLDVQISSLDGGEVRAAAGRVSRGAWRFPTYRDGDVYPRAAVVARPAAGESPLSPDVGGFAYGADIRVDARSFGRAEDNGNNVIQRGLSSDATMFKLEVDANGRPGCTVKGDADEVTVLAVQPLDAGTWYRIRCERRPNLVRVLVSEYLPSGQAITATRQRTGDPGGVTFVGAEVPFSIGGKTARDGSVIKSSTDQFNGEIDNAYVMIPARGRLAAHNQT